MSSLRFVVKDTHVAAAQRQVAMCALAVNAAIVVGRRLCTIVTPIQKIVCPSGRVPVGHLGFGILQNLIRPPTRFLCV